MISLITPLGLQRNSPEVKDVRGLSDWLHEIHAKHVAGNAVSQPSAGLLTAPPAAGKTTLMSQLVLLTTVTFDMVPILIKVQALQRQLLSDREPVVNAKAQLERQAASRAAQQAALDEQAASAAGQVQPIVEDDAQPVTNPPAAEPRIRKRFSHRERAPPS